MLLELATNMTYQEEWKGKVMARYAEKGDTFHILLSGKCSVWLPLQAEQAEKVIKSCIESNAVFKLQDYSLAHLVDKYDGIKGMDKAERLVFWYNYQK